MQNVNALVTQYTTTTTRSYASKSSYFKFNATKAYAQHTINLIQLNAAYKAACATHCLLTMHKINSAIEVAQRKQAYAYKHSNFCLQSANIIINAYKRAK